MIPLALGVSTAAALAVSACEPGREARRFSEQPPTATAQNAVTESPLQPGPKTRDVTIRNTYEENAWAVAEGKRLYSQMNCVGCHAHGGGGMGPPLMDDEWIYGSDPENIFQTIVQGHPNGMPTYRGKLSNQQIWQLVAYVRSLGGLVRSDVAGGRDDHMQKAAQEQATTKQAPKQAFQPPASTHP
jgi:cytochrome c oxidase cbb3-type subunit 3